MKSLSRLLLTIALIFFIAADARAQQPHSNEKAFAASELSLENVQSMALELKYFDEVLTSSVLSYTFSGEEKWLNRYNEYEPKLSKLINTLMQVQLEQDFPLIEHLNRVNDNLVTLENEAISLVQAGDNAAAMAIVNSAHYRENKIEYMSAVMGYIRIIEERILSEQTPVGTSDQIFLTAEERAWISQNKVAVGVELWPPILFMQDENTPAGLTGEILRQIERKTGLQFQYVVDTWEELLNRFRQGEVDLLPNAYFVKDREQFGLYSTPYFMVRELFYVKDSSTRFQSAKDLSKGTIAISGGYVTIDKIKALYPNITIVETSGLGESIKLVVQGDVDALLDAQIVVDDWIEQKNITQLRAIEEDVVYPPSLHLLTNNNVAILHGILQKGLDSIKASDLLASNTEWLKSRDKPIPNRLNELEMEYFYTAVTISVLILIALGTTASSLVLKSSEQKLAQKFGSPKFKRTIMFALICLSTVVISIAYFVISYAERQHENSLKYSLNTLLTTTQHRLRNWVDSELNLLNQLGKNADLVALVDELLVVPENEDALKSALIQTQVRDFFAERENIKDSFGYFIISPNRISLSSRRDNNIGTENIINKARPELLESVLNGKSVFIPPIRSDVFIDEQSADSQQQKPATMFFAAPIKNANDKVIAILTKRVNLHGHFSNILQDGFIGKTGEVYALDKNAILLSDVRFENTLIDIGLLEFGQRSSLNLQIRDPGYDLTKDEETITQLTDWPLTLMAAQLTEGKTGINLEGYRDYRGVMVVGSWLWDNRLNIGLVAEVDVAESKELLYIFKYTIWPILVLSLALVFGGTLFTLHIGSRATRSLARSQADLEELVHERTEELEVNMQRTRAIIDNASDGIIVTNKEGIILEFSPASEAMFGYSADEAIGKDTTFLMNYDIIKSFSEDFIQGKEQHQVYELIGCRKNRELMNVEVNVSGARVEGELTITSIIRNTTLRKKAERELKNAKLKAEEATRAKSEFLANMSHEIRTPMNAIIGMSYLALQTKLSRKQADYIQKIHRSADSLLEIINEILDFSKIEAGKLELEHATFNLTDTLDHLVQIITHKCMEKQLELLIDLDPELPAYLIGDSLRLGQVLINLTNNAVKFTEKGEIVVKVSMLKQGDENIALKFSVKDTGIGMTEKQIQGLFQSFTQADASTTRTYGGTGLGLSISKSLVELMGGDIWVESVFQEGSEFFFTAIFSLADQSKQMKPMSAENLTGLPVLIVDDSPAARNILFNLADSLGFKPEVTSSGEEAIGILKSAEELGTPFKLVLSDWQMPNMDGLQLAQKVVAESLLVETPKFVIVTAYDQDELHQHADHIAFDSVLTKPVSASTLLDTVVNVMDSRGGEASPKVESRIDTSIVHNIAGGRILLVEDNEINQQIAIELLQIAGFDVTVASNGKEAVEYVSQQKFDVVLMDIQMPVMDGYVATGEIRKEHAQSQLPIIAMTANAMSTDKERCLAAGMNAHIAKPIEPHELFKELAKWIAPTGKSIDEIPVQHTPKTAIPKLPEFEVKSALSRMSGNVQAYRKNLQLVAEKEKDVIARIKNAIAQEDYNEAVLAAHSLKGVAGTIGASFVVPSAEQIELMLNQTIDSGKPLDAQELDSQLLDCEVQVAKMINVIKADQQSYAGEQTKSDTFDADKAVGLIKTLSDQIAQFDSMAIDTVYSLQEVLGTAAESDIIIDLISALEAYDFSEAESLVTGLPKFVDELANSNSENGLITITGPELVEKLKALAEQIQNYDSTVIDSVESLLEHDLSAPVKKAIERLQDVLGQYDFDTGETEVLELIAMLEKEEG